MTPGEIRAAEKIETNSTEEETESGTSSTEEKTEPGTSSTEEETEPETSSTEEEGAAEKETKLGTEEAETVEETTVPLAEEKNSTEQELLTGGLLPIIEMTVPEEEVDYFEETVEYSMRRSASYYNSPWDKYSNYYFYNQMSEAERAYWDSLEAMCVEYITENTAGTKTTSGGYRTSLVQSSMGLTKDEMKQVAKIFRYSNPQYYFLNNSIWSTSSAVGFGIYTAFGETADRQAATEKVKTQVEDWQTQIDACSTDAEKVKLIHDLVIEKVEYNKGIYDSDFDENTQYSQSAYSVFCTDLTVCAGYAQAFEMMCNGSGIDAVSVTSTDHQWNKVRIDDSWYNVDCTWDDQSGTVYYNYFERNDAVFDQSTSHYEESFWEGMLPVCTLDSGASIYSPGTLPQISEWTAVPVITGKTADGKYMIELECSTPEAGIYYTLDGTTPEVSAAKSHKYAGSFEITESVVLQAIAVGNGYWDSGILSEEIQMPERYVITYDGNGADLGSMETQALFEGTAFNLSTNLYEKTGYRFAGWNTAADGSGISYGDGAQISGLTQNITLYAQWEIITYRISYELNGGVNAANPTSYHCTDSVVLQAPKRTGYNFEGWYSDAGYSSAAGEIAKGSTGDKVFYAKWSPILYGITFIGNGNSGGSMGKMTDLQYDTDYSLPANTYTRTEYNFTGWNTAADGSGISYGNGAGIRNLTAEAGGMITLYAQWAVKSYTITYKLKGGKNNAKNPASYTKFSGTITLKNPTRTGYAFKGWYSDSNYKKQATQIKKGSTGSKTFYAKWEANKYTIAFNGNGSTSGKMSSLTSRKYGKTYQLTANKFKKKGYTFVGWNTKKDGSGKTYKNKEKIKNLTSKSGGKVTLYAQWKKTKYTITYKLKGGKNAAKNPGYYYYTTKTITLKKPTRKGYQFVGWYSDSKYKNKVTKIKKGSTGNITLYAKWKKK